MFNLRTFGDVCLNRAGHAAGLINFLDDLLKDPLVPGRQDHLRPLARALKSQLLSNSTRSARNNHDFIFQIHIRNDKKEGGSVELTSRNVGSETEPPSFLKTRNYLIQV